MKKGDEAWYHADGNVVNKRDEAFTTVLHEQELMGRRRDTLPTRKYAFHSILDPVLFRDGYCLLGILGVQPGGTRFGSY